MSNPDLIALGSTVISLCALFGTFWQALLSRKHSRLSTKPHLVWHISRQNTGPRSSGIIFSLRNLGLGPAIIKDRYFTKDEIRFPCPLIKMNEVKEFLEFVYGDRIHYKLKEFGLPGIGSAIASGQEILIANIEFPKVHFDHLQSAVELAGRVGFHVIYESIYQDRVELHQS